MEKDLEALAKDFNKKIQDASSLLELDRIFLELFGKKGKITIFPKSFPSLDKGVLRKIVPLFNQVKLDLERKIDERRNTVREIGYQRLSKEILDLTKPTKIKRRKGHLHPMTEFENQVVGLFRKISFNQFDSPHIETDYYNFEALNIPENHPARDLWDTLYIETDDKKLKGKLLLRTHTSAFQNKAMKTTKIPIRLINVGRCFRYENLDARHEHTFDQFDLIYVDKKVTMSNLQYLSEYFLKSVFGPEIKVRMRPKYYPFVEPGVGIDGECIFCKGAGCKICGNVGWLELAGAGMIHPNVLRRGGIDPKEYSGLAWGFGPFRMAMIKFGINDIRVFNSGDLKQIYNQ